MMENEDSVVTSLNELRKLKNERITRQTQSRPSVAPSRVSTMTEDPVADQLTPPPIQGPALTAMRNSAAFDPGAGFDSAGRGGFSHTPIAYDPAPAQVMVRPRSSVKAAVVVAVLFAGGGGAGYVKLQGDTQAMLAAKDATIRQSEEARNRAVEMGAKADQVARNNLKQCEEKLKGSMAMAPAVAPSAPSPTAPSTSVAQKAERPTVATRAAHSSGHKAAARSARHASAQSAQSESASTKNADVPSIAKKKKVELDPLAGLGKL